MKVGRSSIRRRIGEYLLPTYLTGLPVLLYASIDGYLNGSCSFGGLAIILYIQCTVRYVFSQYFLQ